MKYEKMFSRGKIGNLNLKSRIVMPAMGTGIIGSDCMVNDAAVAYVQARAKSGCGLIITGVTRVAEGEGVGAPRQVSATDSKYIPGLRRLADAVHRYDTKIFLQLQHPGRVVSRSYTGGLQPVGPSAIMSRTMREMPREMTTEECEELVQKFAKAAAVAQQAGIDGVEIHGAHGYLIAQFLSAYSNQRTDKYGGSLEKRMTILVEIVQAIQKRCGRGFPISVRLSCDEFVDGGMTIDQSVIIARKMEELGVAAINVSAGCYESGHTIIEPQYLPEGFKKHLAVEMKKHVSIPVIAVNNIKNPATAEQYLQEGVCDFVGIGRSHIADPNWAAKAKAGKENEIRHCIGCMHCFVSYGTYGVVECTVNPTMAREYLFPEDSMVCDGAGKTVAVIGGGPAGMQAAAILGQRGYRTVLFEKGDKLGGTCAQAAIPPHKEGLAALIRTQTVELEQAGVEIRLNTEATPELVAELDPYGVIVATGAKPIVPPLAGATLPNVYTVEQAITGQVDLAGKKVVVIGGGVTGLETAHVLAEKSTVTVVEMTKYVATTVYGTVRLLLMGELKEAGVKVLTLQKVEEITEAGVKVTDLKSGETSVIDADAVVLSVGIRPEETVAEQFEAAFDHVVRVGDAEKAANISEALRAAHDKAWVF